MKTRSGTPPGTDSKSRRALSMDELPARQSLKLRWFTWYSKRYVEKHFNAYRVTRGSSPPSDPNRPLVIYLNHASWWDPLVCLTLTDHCFPHRPAFAPIDADQLERYRIFRGLGFFGVDQGSVSGAAHFLRTAGRILSGPNVLWITPQGRFCDVRERPLRLAGGLAHLALRHPNATFVPLAIEYPFWHDRNPEILIRWGQPVPWEGFDLSRNRIAAVEQHLSRALEQTQDELAQRSMSQDPEQFESLMWGQAGVGGVYDQFRRLKAWVQGRSFEARHDIPTRYGPRTASHPHQLSNPS